jgi:hypothetical protein
MPGAAAILRDSVTINPVSGVLESNGQQIVYRHVGNVPLTHSIDSFTYRIRSGAQIFTAKVYVYVIQSAKGGFSTCNTTYTVELKGTNVNYTWYNETGVTLLGSPNPSYQRALTGVTTDQRFQVQPTRTAQPYQGLVFPKALLTIKKLSAGDVMRWTGLVDHNWHNPQNWVAVVGDHTTPVSWEPASCVDVEIPSEVTSFPELVDSAYAQKITMKDRAMLKNPHALNYATAQVEIKLKPSERGRFVLWSAPLKAMYSGDYHYKNSSNQPRWGDVYISLFQQANPAGGAAQPNMFTATFGQLGAALELGTAFNLRVEDNSETKDNTLVFPQTPDSYTDTNGTNYTLTGRSSKYKFVTYGVAQLADSSFTLPLTSTNTGSNLVQVVNPYLAYLDVTKFLAANSASLSTGGYVIWDGNLKSSFMAVKFDKVGMRYLYSGTIAPVSTTNPNLIAPLQSFFVQKVSTSNLTQVKMSPAWTTTVGENPYTLRSSLIASDVLHITATQGDKTSSTALQYEADASSAYRGSEDVLAGFFDEIPLTIYTLSSQRQPLAINTSNNFTSEPVDLGLRVTGSGEVKLEFSGLSTFRHKVFLIDKQLNKEIDLQQTPEHSFTVVANGATEVNDRFALRMESSITGSEAIATPSWRVYAKDSYIYVQSEGEPIESLQIYNTLGSLIYSASSINERQHKVAVSGGQQIYLVRARIGNVVKTEKVIVIVK